MRVQKPELRIIFSAPKGFIHLQILALSAIRRFKTGFLGLNSNNYFDRANDDRPFVQEGEIQSTPSSTRALTTSAHLW